MNNNSLCHEMTIVVNTCDTYCDVLEIFFYALNNYWPNCPYPIVINAESLTYKYPVRVHNYRSTSGADDWGGRMRSTLESIDTQFVLMVYDDFILDASVCNERIELALQVLKSQMQAVVTYLIHTSIPLEPITEKVFVPIRDRVNYRLNSSPAIWKKKALMDYTFAGDTPWAWEAFGTYRTWGDGNVFYSLNPAETDIYPYNYLKGGAIYRGKWVREVVESLPQKYPLQIDWKIRGFSSDLVNEKRTWIWKMKFMKTGFCMVGYKAIYFVISYIRDKIHAH